MDVGVIGCGYVGLVSAVGLASAGHRVIGIEISEDRRKKISDGIPPFHEPGLDEVLNEVLGDGRFSVSGDLTDVADCRVVLLAVQTPPRDDGTNDVRYLQQAASSLAELWKKSPAQRRVIAIRSTVVPGTSEEVVTPILEEAGLDSVAVASNPEFLAEGTAVADFLDPDRVVIGCHENWALETMRELYAPLTSNVIGMSPRSAELAKYTSNAFLATLVSFSNEIASMCEGLPGVDVEDVLGALHEDRRLRVRVGERSIEPQILSYLKAGCGFGGSCLPKDIRALIGHQRAAGKDRPLLRAVHDINSNQPAHLVDLAEDHLGGLKGRRVGVLGAAFKGGTDDLRDSPGLKVLDDLLQRGAQVVLHDPLVSREQLGSYVQQGVEVTSDLEGALDGDAVLVTNNAPEFMRLHDLLGELDSPPIVVDGRRFLDAERFNSGYVAIGRGPVQTIEDSVS